MNNYQKVRQDHEISEDSENIEQDSDATAEEPPEVKEARSALTEMLVSVSKDLTGERVPVRIDSENDFGGNSYGAVLDRNQLRVPVERAFSKPQKYTIFGRVEDKISESGEWDPIDTTRVLESFASEDVGVTDFMEVIRNVAKSQQVEMLDEHITVAGPVVIIDPLAVYW